MYELFQQYVVFVKIFATTIFRQRKQMSMTNQSIFLLLIIEFDEISVFFFYFVQIIITAKNNSIFLGTPLIK